MARRIHGIRPALTATVALIAAAVVSGQNYVPETRYRGTSLAGTRPLGDASWRAEQGEYVGVPKSPAGGWLILDRALQDAGVFAEFRCTGGCRTGVLLRAERTEAGMKGVYVALTGDEPGVYAVTLDANGREQSRERLRAAGGQIRFAPPPPPPGQTRGGGAGRASGAAPAGPPPNLPLTPPATGLKPNDWNLVEILLDASLIRPFLNESLSTIGSAAVDESAGVYGPVALFVGGSGEVRYRNVGTSDLGLKTTPAERSSANFTMERISDMFYSWGAAVADFNADGLNDVAAGPYYYLGPSFTRYREIYAAQTINPSVQYPGDCMQQFAHDVTGDGAPDVICMGAIGQDLHLYVNPRNERRRWSRFDVVPLVQKEVSLFTDVDADGQPEFVYGGGGFLRFAEPDPKAPTGPWNVHTLSTEGPWGGGHGLGVGDISGDGRVDVVDPYGWWEQPAGGAASGVWTYHPQAFGRWTGHASPGGAEMGVYDVNGDGLTDVITSLQAHGFGLAWFEQKRDGSGARSWVRHMIIDDFGAKNVGGVVITEMHGSTVADVDGDGIRDFIVGKRYWSHLDNYTDPDPYGPPVLYVFLTRRNKTAPGGASFVPELVHNRSGAGNAVTAADVNQDGRADIVTSTDRGTFVFLGRPRARN